ncbi:MAG: rRNA maturation RNase YbeY [Phycisphaerales bacterium]|nr:rRNA maturation RNase YbeY [Phycisphaerales bacterium]
MSPGSLEWLRARSRAALGVLDTSGEVRARIVHDDEMAAAHVRHLDIAGTTDVLTFDLRDDPDERTLDVDLLICLDEARRQASARGHEPERELLLYIVHGVLHCLGHDDHDEEDARRMHDLEDRTLEAIGVGVTFERNVG